MVQLSEGKHQWMSLGDRSVLVVHGHAIQSNMCPSVLSPIG